MTAKQQDPERTADRSDRQRVEAVIGRQVLELLGRPKTSHRASVRYLWEGHYRVNVLIGEEAAFAEIAHSYFLTADGEGKILESLPAIKKLY